MDLFELEIWRLRHAELVKQAEQVRLVRLLQAQQPPVHWRLRLWMGDRLVLIGNRLKAGHAALRRAIGRGVDAGPPTLGLTERFRRQKTGRPGAPS